LIQFSDDFAANVCVGFAPIPHLDGDILGSAFEKASG